MSVKGQAAMVRKILKIRDRYGLSHNGSSIGVAVPVLMRAGELLVDPMPRPFAWGSNQFSHKFHRWYKCNAKQIKFLLEAGML